MSPNFLLAIDRIREQLLALVWQPIKEKENSEFRPAVLPLKIDHVSHPVAEELGKYIKTQREFN